MRTIEVEELREHLGEVMNEVRRGEVIDIASQGEVIARLSPTAPVLMRRALTQAEIEADLARLDALRDEISKHVTEPVDAAQLISDMRR